MIEKRTDAAGRIRYRVRVGRTKRTLGTFERQADAKRAEAEWVSANQPAAGAMPADEFAERWARGERFDNKPLRQSTITTSVYGVRGFTEHFGGRPLDRIDQNDALDFARTHKTHEVMSAKALMADAAKRRLISSDPFAHIDPRRGPGRKHDRVLERDEVDHLAAKAIDTLGREYGQEFAAAIYFAAYVGPRISMQLAVESSDVDFRDQVVTYRASFDRNGEPVPWTKETEEGETWPVVLLDEAARPLRALPARLDGGYVFRAKRGGPLRPNNHWSIWNAVRAAAGFPELDWHGLRHFCGHHFYVTLGFSAELAGWQLCHHDGEQVRRLYGHGSQDALDRLRRGIRAPRVVAIDEEERRREVG